MATIRSKEYDEDEQRLMNDPIVVQMASEIPDEFDWSHFTHNDGSPNFDFMMNANSEYTQRGGKGHAHIGAIAHAILKVKGLE